MSQESETAGSLDSLSKIKNDETKAQEEASVGQFLEDSSLHGVRYLHSNSKATRIIWGVFVLASAAGIIYNVQDVMIKYNNHPVKNNIRAMYPEKLEFPVVTICTRNQFKESGEMSSMPEVFWKYGGYFQFALYNDLELFDWSRDVNNYNWSDPGLIAFNSAITEENWLSLLNSLSPKLEETFFHCKWKGIRTECTELFAPIMTHHGICWVFNRNQTYTTNAPGKNAGLEVLLDARFADYSPGTRSDSTGFMVAVHDKDELPNFDIDLINAPPSFATDIRIKKVETHRLPYPADNRRSNCLDTDDPNISTPMSVYDLDYSRSSCYLICEAKYMNETCGCKMFSQFLPGGVSDMLNLTACTYYEILTIGLSAAANFTSDPMGLDSCDCPPSCHKVQYEAETTMSLYPSKSRLASLIPAGMDPIYRYSEYNAMWIDRMAKVNIFFKSTDYTLLEQEYEYTLESLLADCGGLMGLLLGASIMSIMEFVQFLVTYCLTAAERRKRTAPAPQHQVIQVKTIYN